MCVLALASQRAQSKGWRVSFALADRIVLSWVQFVIWLLQHWYWQQCHALDCAGIEWKDGVEPLLWDVVQPAAKNYDINQYKHIPADVDLRIDVRCRGNKPAFLTVRLRWGLTQTIPV